MAVALRPMGFDSVKTESRRDGYTPSRRFFPHAVGPWGAGLWQNAAAPAVLPAVKDTYHVGPGVDANDTAHFVFSQGWAVHHFGTGLF